MIQTQVLIIGITKYVKHQIQDLPGAEIDAMDLARALLHWGIANENITLLVNSMATKKNIRSYFQSLENAKESFHLVVYFCGHGFRPQSADRKSYLLLADSEIIEDKCIRGIKLEKLVEYAHKLNAQDTYLFIDACSLRLNTIPNPKLQEELQGKNDSNKGFFCLLSSGIKPSYEDTKGQFGYFTQALIKSLSQIRTTTSSPSVLLDLIQKDLISQNLPLPEMYNIGIQTIQFLPPILFSYCSKHFLIRANILADLQDLMAANRNNLLLLHGEKGIGKTTLIKQFLSEKFKIFEVRLKEDPNTQLDSYEKKFPFSWILIDYADLVSSDLIKQLKKLSKRKLRFIIISQYSISQSYVNQLEISVCNYELPAWTLQEVQSFLKSSEIHRSNEDIEFIYLVSQGSPLKIKRIISKHSVDHLDEKIKDEIKKAIGALCAAGIYLNEQLFCTVFKIENKALAFLEHLGLVTRLADYSIPHELLFEIAEDEKLEINKECTLKYWSQQFEELPHHHIAAENFILTVNCFGYERQFDFNLKQSFQTVLKTNKSNTKTLFHGAQIFFDAYLLSEAALLLSEILIEGNHLELANKLLSLPPKNNKIQQASKVIKAQLLWKKGDFVEAINFASKFIQNTPQNHEQIMFLFHRGIANFFLGNWEDARSDLLLIHNNVSNTKYVGWARCMLGTVDGIRGLNIEKSKELLESGIKLLLKCQDLSGTWFGWNNLGEILFKLGDFKPAAFFLNKAHEQAKKLDNSAMQIETMRNLLSLRFLKETTPSKETTFLLAKTEDLLSNTCESFEGMQIYNTLATYYLLQKETQRAISHLKKAIPLTAKSKEYHIYTLMNLALLFKIKGKHPKAQAYHECATQLAKQGNNILALKQIQTNWNAKL